MSTRLIIAGAGGFGRGVYGWASDSPHFLKEFDIINIFYIDDNLSNDRANPAIISSIKEYIPTPSDLVLCAIANPAAREQVVELLSRRGARFPAFVDDRAVIAPNVSIGEGAIICPGTIISAGAQVGKQVHINFNCSIGHDTEIGQFSTLSPSVNLMGELKVGHSVFFGGSAAVLPRLKIGSGSQIGAGAVVTKNVPKQVVVKGVPGKWND